MQTWLAAIDDLPEIVSHGIMLIIVLAALAVGGVRERLAAGGVLAEDTATLIVRVYLAEPWSIVATVMHSAFALMVYAAMSWRWPHRWLIILIALQCLSLQLILGRWIDPSISHTVNLMSRDGCCL